VRTVLLAAGFVACIMAAARGVAALPKAMHGGGIGPLYTSEEAFFRTLNGDF
jgi:hypothetical protein